jgi:hypothetical protein
MPKKRENPSQSPKKPKKKSQKPCNRCKVFQPAGDLHALCVKCSIADGNLCYLAGETARTCRICDNWPLSQWEKRVKQVAALQAAAQARLIGAQAAAKNAAATRLVFSQIP